MSRPFLPCLAALAVLGCVFPTTTKSSGVHTATTTTTTTEPTDTGGTPTCPADHCVHVADDGTIDTPALQLIQGESVAFLLGNRWQSVVEVSTDDPAACDGPDLELAYAADAITGPMPRLSGGLTVRGEPDGAFRFPAQIWESDAVTGTLLVVPWGDVEPQPDVYDFAVFTEALAEATRYGKLVSVGIQAGGKSPAWLFEPPVDVPHTDMLVKSDSGDRCFDEACAHFWEPTYVARLTALQAALATELKAHGGSWRHVDKIKISGVNLLTSETRMPVDRDVPCGSGPLTTGDQPQLWADAGYTPDVLYAYFDALWLEQQALFPDKDLNLMEINRAFPNVDAYGVVQGFADPEHVRELIRRSIPAVPGRFVVLNAALGGTNVPQDTCLMAWDMGAAQIGFQTKNGLHTWADLQPALDNGLNATTPEGDTPVSFLEIYLDSATAALDDGHAAELRGYDEAFRARAGLSEGGATFEVTPTGFGLHHYKVAGNAMTSAACHLGSIEVVAR